MRKSSFNIIILSSLLTIIGVTDGLADDRLLITYSNTTQENFYGSYRYYDSRQGVDLNLFKTAGNFDLKADLEFGYTPFLGSYVRSFSTGIARYPIKSLKLNLDLGNFVPSLPYTSGLNNSNVRGINFGLQGRLWELKAFGGIQPDFYDQYIKPGTRQIYGMTLRYEVLSRLTLKPYLIYSQSNLAEDSLSRKTNSGGLGLEVKPWNWLGWDITLGMNDRDQQIQGTVSNLKSLSLTTGANLRFKPLTLNLGYDYSDPFYQTSSLLGRQGPRAGIWWRPSGFVSFNGNINQSRPVGSALSYRTESLQRGLGASLNLPRMPLINLEYQQGDQNNSFQNQTSYHYRTVTQGAQLSKRYPKFDWSLRYRLSDNQELSQNLQKLATQTIDARVTRFWGGKSSWLNFEQAAYFDHFNGTSSRTGWGKLGTEGRFYSWLTLGAEGGAGLENQSGGKRLLWQHSLQTKMNLPWNFTAQGYWRNNRNLKKIEDGRDYDQNTFSFSISKRIGLEGTSLEGQVFNDLNRNGLRDQNEPGLSQVKLTLNNGQETRTDSKGSYAFDLVRSRQAKVAVDMATLSADYNLVGKNEVVVATGGWRGNVVNFAVTSLGGIKGRVFVDVNSNGVFDDGDYGLSGVTLLLQPANLSAVSNGGGNFRFYNVPVGKNEVMVDSTSVPGELELKTREGKPVSIRQGEFANGLEFFLVKKERKVKKVVFGGESMVTVAAAATIPSQPKAADQIKPVPGRSRVVTPRPGSVQAPAVSGPKLSLSQIDAFYKEGSQLFSSGDYQGSLKVWQKILSADPGHANAKRNLERTRQKLEAQRKAKG